VINIKKKIGKHLPKYGHRISVLQSTQRLQTRLILNTGELDKKAGRHNRTMSQRTTSISDTLQVFMYEQ
jgi:hypothetical protein